MNTITRNYSLLNYFLQAPALDESNQGGWSTNRGLANGSESSIQLIDSEIYKENRIKRLLRRV